MADISQENDQDTADDRLVVGLYSIVNDDPLEKEPAERRYERRALYVDGKWDARSDSYFLYEQQQRLPDEPTFEDFKTTYNSGFGGVRALRPSDILGSVLVVEYDNGSEDVDGVDVIEFDEDDLPTDPDQIVSADDL